MLDDLVTAVLVALAAVESRSNRVRAHERLWGRGDMLRAIWKAADTTPGPFGAFVKFLLFTGGGVKYAEEEGD